MACRRTETRLATCPPQHSGRTMLELGRPSQAIDQAVVKTSRTQGKQAPRKSARLERLQHKKPVSPAGLGRSHRDDFESVASRENRTQQQYKPVSRKRSRTPDDQITPEIAFGVRHKRRRGSTEESTLSPASRRRLSGDDEDPISYWVTNLRWPRKRIEQVEGMESILARKRSTSSRSRKNSDAGSWTPTSTNQEGTRSSREQKSAEYARPQYKVVLATKCIFTKPSFNGVASVSKKWCKDLLRIEQDVPEGTLFRDDLFESTCLAIQDRNETRVIRDIALLIVPSAEVLSLEGARHLECLIDSVNEGWSNAISITKIRPQPDYAVGFRREAFTQAQLDRMHPIVGDFNDQSYFMATWYMYFPFLTCEVKCGVGALDIADRQNAHSAAIAARAVVELFRAVKREKELHREILAFSISHDCHSVRIYGHYVEFEDTNTKYYRHLVHKFDFTTLDGREKWTAYKFTKNLYDHWMPMHFKRICSAIDQIPADISFSVSHSELQYSDPSSRLSEDFGAHSTAQSSAGAESSMLHEHPATTSTSVTGGAFKKPRKGDAGRGRK